MDEVTEWKPHPNLKMLADILRGTTDFLNKPGKVFGTGLGDIITGKSGDYIEDRAYGMPMTQGTGFARQLTNKEGLLDTMFLPGVGAIAGAARKGGTKVVETGMDFGRRAAMGNLGRGALAAGAATVAPTLVLDALRSGAKVARKEAIPLATKTIASQFTRDAAAKDIRSFLDMYGEDVSKVAAEKLTSEDLDLLNKAFAKEAAEKAAKGYSDEFHTSDAIASIIDKYGWGPE